MPLSWEILPGYVVRRGLQNLEAWEYLRYVRIAAKIEHGFKKLDVGLQIRHTFPCTCCLEQNLWIIRNL